MEHIKSDQNIRTVVIGITLFCSALRLMAQSDQVSNLAQFLFPEFCKSVIKMHTGKSLTMMLNYNIVTEKIVFLQKEEVFELLNDQNVDTIIMNNGKFIPAGKVFHEVILSGAVCLFVQHKASIQGPGKSVGFGATSQVSSSTNLSRVDLTGNGSSMFNRKLPDDLIIKPETVYWISFNDKKFSFTNKQQFLKVFPGKEGEIKKFIKENSIKFENREDVIKLAKFSYGLIK